MLVSDKFDPSQPYNRRCYRILHVLWVIGLTLAMVMGLFYAYVYFINFGGMARGRHVGTAGRDSQVSKINNNFYSPYNYQGVLGQVRLARERDGANAP